MNLHLAFIYYKTMKTISWLGVCNAENSVEQKHIIRLGTMVILKSFEIFTDIQTVQWEAISPSLCTTSNNIWFHDEPTVHTRFIDP